MVQCIVWILFNCALGALAVGKLVTCTDSSECVADYLGGKLANRNYLLYRPPHDILLYLLSRDDVTTSSVLLCDDIRNGTRMQFFKNAHIDAVVIFVPSLQGEATFLLTQRLVLSEKYDESKCAYIIVLQQEEQSPPTHIVSRMREDFLSAGITSWEIIAIGRHRCGVITMDENGNGGENKGGTLHILCNQDRNKLLPPWNNADNHSNANMKYCNPSRVMHFCKLQSSPIMSQQLKKLHNCSLKIASVHGEPYVISSLPVDDVSRDGGMGGDGTGDGIFTRLFALAARKMGVELQLHPDNWAFNEDFIMNGTVGRMYEEMLADRIDVAIGRLYIDIDHNQVGFGPTFFTDHYRFALRKPKSQLIYRNLLRPFALQSWLAILCAMLATAFLLSLTAQLQEVQSLPNNDRGAFQHSSVPLSDIVRASILGAIPNSPAPIPARLIFIFYSLHSLNICSIYLGALSGIFTRPLIDTPISSTEMVYLRSVVVAISARTDQMLGIHQGIGDNAKMKTLFPIARCREMEMVRRVATLQENGTMTPESVLQLLQAEAEAVDVFTPQFSTQDLYLTFWYRKSNMMNRALLYWVDEIIEKGFPTKWLRDLRLIHLNYTLMRLVSASSTRSYHHYQQPSKQIDKDYIGDGDNVGGSNSIVLTLRHYEEALGLLLIGDAIAVLVFCSEFIAKFLSVQVDYMHRISAF